MRRGNMFVRFGNGSVRQIKDQYEANWLRDQTGDEDLFVFQEPDRPGRHFNRWELEHKMPARFHPHEESRNPVQKIRVDDSAKNRVKELRGPVTGHAGASLLDRDKPRVRLLDNGLDPKIPVKTGGSRLDNPVGTARKMEKKATKANALSSASRARTMESLARDMNRVPPRNASKDARNMEAEAAKMLEPSVAGKIFQGLGETFRKTPAGIAEAFREGVPAIGEATGKMVDTFLHDKRMHEGLKKAGKYALIGAAIPAVMVGGAYAATKAPAIYTTLLGNPQLFNEATDLVEGAFTPGPGPNSLGGAAGTALSYPWDTLTSPKGKKK